MTGSLIWRWFSHWNDEGSSIRDDRNYLFEIIYDYHFGRGAVSIPAAGGIETAPRQQPKEPSRKASQICGKKKTSKTTLKMPLTPQVFLCLAAVASIWQRIFYSIWLSSRWLSFRNQILKWLSFRNPEKVRNDYLFDMMKDFRFDMTAHNFRYEIKLKSFYELLQNDCYSQSNVIY